MNAINKITVTDIKELFTVSSPTAKVKRYKIRHYSSFLNLNSVSMLRFDSSFFVSGLVTISSCIKIVDTKEVFNSNAIFKFFIILIINVY